MLKNLFTRTFDLKKIFTYLLLVICLAYVVREFIYVGLRKNATGEFDKLNTIFIKQNNYDVLIIGSSRAESHFVPFVIDSITGLSSFNAGQSGAMQEMNLTVLRSYLVHSTSPNVAVLNIDIHLPNSGNDTIHHFPKYFPFLGNDTLYDHLKNHDRRFKYFKWMPFYSLPYTNDYYLSASLRGWLGMTGETDKTYFKGFTPEQKWVEDTDKDQNRAINYSFPPVFYKSINDIIAVCNQNNIKLVMVVSPLYCRLSEMIVNRSTIIAMLKQLANNNGVIFMDYTTDDICTKKEYFINSRHLNKVGAYKFSQKFACQLLQYLP
jgi:hypothetical protein